MPTGVKIIEERFKMKITYHSHDVFEIETSKARLIIDPFLTGNENAAIKAEDIKVDYILLTHAHADHFGDSVLIAKNNGATLIAPFETALLAQSKGVKKIHPMHIGGGYGFDFGRVKLTIAHHGSGLPGDNGIEYGGNPCGFLITADGKTVYHAGDTGLFLDMKLIGERNDIDVALLPIGDNFTMGIDDAVKAVEFLSPALTIPMHYSTFPVIQADPKEFVKKIETNGAMGRVLRFGETMEI